MTARPETKAKLTKVFWFFFSKKNKKKHFFLKKEVKTFVNCFLFADFGWGRAVGAPPGQGAGGHANVRRDQKTGGGTDCDRHQ